MDNIQKNKTRLFFTSDMWFGRNNIIDIFDRPFANTQEMDSKIIENWNMTVTDDDIVFVLGNAIYDATKIHNILTELNGVKVLMLSETDKNVFRADDMYVNELTAIQKMYDVEEYTQENNMAIYENYGFLTSDEILSSVLNIADIYKPNIIILKNSIVDIADYGIVISLYPLMEWNSKQYGTLNLHGGVLPSSDDLNVDNRISVRTDFWGFRPVCLDEINTLVKQLKNI